MLREMRTNFDKPEVMKDLQKKLLCADSVLQRMTIIGVLLSFRSLAQEALCDVCTSTCCSKQAASNNTSNKLSIAHVACCTVQVLENHIPFLMSSIKDFQHHLPNGQDSMVCGDEVTYMALMLNLRIMCDVITD